jgi:hypothetical protein
MNISPVKNGISRVISEPFSESDVLYLQDLFLKPGIHDITIDQFDKVRNILSEVLNSLQYHQKIACLSLLDLPLDFNKDGQEICDVLKILITEDYLVTSDSLQLFFLDHFYFDFLWIEETQEMRDCLWYSQFVQHLIDFNFNNSIPIIRVILA